MDSSAVGGGGFLVCASGCGEGGGACFLAFAYGFGLFVEVGDGFGWGAEEGDFEFG